VRRARRCAVSCSRRPHLHPRNRAQERRRSAPKVP
jgi:hypothetical protein